MATVEQLTVQFSGKGASVLTKQISTLAAAMNRLAAVQGKHAKATTQVTAAQGKVNNEYVRNHRNQKKALGITTKFGQAMSGLRSKLLIWAFALGMVTQAFMKFANAAKSYLQNLGKIESIIRSTGGAASRTSGQLLEMADAMQESLAISNTSIMEMQSRLLTFTNIVGENFDKSIELAVDMSKVFGQDLNQSIIQVGKAINDPILGMSSLRRIGVSFNEQQINQVKLFLEQGNVLKAQGVILGELEKEFGGAAEAQADFAEGVTELNKAGNTWSDNMRIWSEDSQSFISTIGKTLNKMGLIAQGEDLSKALTITEDGEISISEYSSTVMAAVMSGVLWLGQLGDTEEKIKSTSELYKENVKRLVDVGREVKNAEKGTAKWIKGYKDDVIKLVESGNYAYTSTEDLQKQVVKLGIAFKTGTPEEFNKQMDIYNQMVLNNSESLSQAKEHIEDHYQCQ